MPVAASAPPRRVDAAPQQPPPTRRTRRWVRYRTRTFYAFVAPWLLGLCGLTLLPMAYALWLSFTNSDGFSDNARFIGLENYRQIFRDPQVLHSLGRTGLFTVVVVPLSVIGSLLLAMLINRPVRGRGFFRTLFYLPAVVPSVAAALAWKLLFDRDSGAINSLLVTFGGGPVAWLQDPAVAYVLMSLMLWGIGGGMIISLAGLQDVPKELQEAARVDGAGPWRVFRHVTVPIISPVLLFQVVTGVIGALQTYVQPILLAPNPSGVPSPSSVSPGNDLYVVHVFSQGFSLGRFGYASAMLWLLFLVILLITLLILRLSRSLVFYNVNPDKES